LLNREPVSATEEKRIVVGLIISTEYIEQVLPIFRLDYFVNSYLQVLASWSFSFYEQYQKAPFKHIKDIFNAESRLLSDTETELIQILLTDIGNNYEKEDINLEYWVEMTSDYFRSRELEITVNNISVLKEKGNLEEAELEIENFRKVTLEMDQGIIINPGDIKIQEEIYDQRDRLEKEFFVLPGDLGKYLGNQKRGDVVGYFGPAKKGKTWTLINNYKYGILSKRRTLFWSIEMTRTEVLPRTNKAFFPMVDTEDGDYTFPVFDCAHNQTGNCADRNSETIIMDNGDYISDPAHKICTKCMRDPLQSERKRFEMSVYQDTIRRQKDDIFAIREKHRLVKDIWNRYGRLAVHPKYSLTYDKMMRDVDVLWRKEKWTPDIAIIDYVDILGINSSFDDYRLDDEKWKLLAKIAGKLNILVITATQGNKAAHTAPVLDATHQGGFYGKNRHVNLMVGLNQNAEDRKRGIMRFGITEARSVANNGELCVVLQDFKSGQSYLDSYCPF